METRIRQYVRWAVLRIVLLGILCGSGMVWAGPALQSPLTLRLAPVFESVVLDRPLLLLEAPFVPPVSEKLPGAFSATQVSRVWFVVEQAGRVLRLEQTGTTVKRTLLIDLQRGVESGPNEAGLLGMALDPRFAQNGQVYLSYTRKGKKREGASLMSVLSRFISRDGGRSLDSDSEQVLLQVAQPYSNHNGGHVQFGPDGYLYFGLGDGGSAGDPKGNGQNTQTLLGAMLRLDVSGGGAYQIPPDNPFIRKGGRAEIYAYGLRNPWRWSFDRQAGDLWLADVGQNAWEEVNVITHGGNYGWNLREGAHCYSGDCDRPNLIEPVAEYSHDDGCSITGGYVYRGKKMPGLAGVYLFADFCSGNIWGLFRNESQSSLPMDKSQYTRRLLLESQLNIASFAEDREGEIYIVDLGGKIFQISSQGPGAWSTPK